MRQYMCGNCSAPFAVGLPMCPRCTSTNIVREENRTVHLSGRVLLPMVLQSEPGPELADRPEEASWVGSSSLTLPEKQPPNDGPARPNLLSRVLTTGGRSKSTEESGTALTATTSGRATDASDN